MVDGALRDRPVRHVGRGFLTALNQNTTTSTTNLSCMAGVPMSRLMGEWALGVAIDDFPGMTPLSTTPQMPMWNLRDIYAGMNADPLLSFGRQWPVTYTQTFNFGPIGLERRKARLRGLASRPWVHELDSSGFPWFQTGDASPGGHRQTR